MTLEGLLHDLAAQYAAIPEVVAVVHSGSRTSGRQDEDSDLDLYVYSRDEVPVALRQSLVSRRASCFEVNNRIAETGDEWIERDRGLHIDVMFRPVASFEAHFLYLFEKFEARPGYSTAVWHNVRSSSILFDPEGWFARLQQQADRPYPEDLARAIIALNVPLLHGAINSRAAQVGLAARRGDIVAVNGALTKLLASYFDVLFALNRALHPGEKRQLSFLDTLADVPPNAARDIERLLSFTTATLPEVRDHVEAVVTPLLRLLEVRRQLPVLADTP